MSSERDVAILQAIEELDRILGGVIAAGEVTVPARPAALRALENLWLARRTLGSVHPEPHKHQTEVVMRIYTSSAARMSSASVRCDSAM